MKTIEASNWVKVTREGWHQSVNQKISWTTPYKFVNTHEIPSHYNLETLWVKKKKIECALRLIWWKNMGSSELFSTPVWWSQSSFPQISRLSNIWEIISDKTSCYHLLSALPENKTLWRWPTYFWLTRALQVILIHNQDWESLQCSIFFQ